MAVRHALVSLVPDDAASAAAGDVLPSDWNDDHVVLGSPLAVTMLTDYAGLDLTGATDSTAALVAAVAATPLGGTLELPIGYIKFSTITLPRRIRIVGQGWSSIVQDAFGSANWTNKALFGGTVLISTATSGPAITSTIPVNRLDLADFLLIGPGSGTSTGVVLGTAANDSQQCQWSNLGVANFATGIDLKFVLDSSFHDIRIRGCSTGLSLSEACNQDVFVNTEVQFSSVDGIVVGTNGGGPLSFVGILLQNCSGTAAIRTATSAAQLCRFREIYMEAITCTFWVDFAAGGGHELSAVHFSGAGGPIRIAAGSCTVEDLIAASGTPAMTLSGSYNRIIRPGLFVITDTGNNNYIFEPAAGRITNGSTIRTKATGTMIDFNGGATTYSITPVGGGLKLGAAGVGGPLELNTGTGGSNLDMYMFALRLFDQAGVLRMTVAAGSYDGFALGSATPTIIRRGTGTPEGVVTAPVGSMFHRTDGGAGTCLYVKESGAGNTGWVAK